MARYGITIFLSAFLLFQVQPIIAKAILPWFGGSPSVWTTCMLFFQTLLVAGYAYAHFLSQRLSTRGFTLLHFALIGLAFLFLPIIPAEIWRPTGNEAPAMRLLLLLFATICLPYLVLSASNPLLQSWFHEEHGTTPYRLFALSNLGSLLGLLTYPFIVEPNFTIRSQAIIWSVVFAAYAACFVWCGVRRLQHFSKPQTASPKAKAASEPARKISVREWTPWIALPACASLLLLAITNQICQNIAVIPFLWVAPLSLYLLSFIICFDHARWYDRRIWAPFFVVSLGAIIWTRFGEPSILIHIAIYLVGLLSACMLCHGELARLKPPPSRLTLYYLLISIGGALGGLAVSVIAPLIFNDYWELHVGLVLTAALLCFHLFRHPEKSTEEFDSLLKFTRNVWIGGIVILIVCLSLDVKTRCQATLETVRNFYGTLRVTEAHVGENTHRYLLYHGDIVHGTQFSYRTRRFRPTTYYGPDSGVSYAIRRHPTRLGRHAPDTNAPPPRIDFPPLRIGAIGLGVGTVAAYAKTNDVLRFYEIDPDVKTLAEKRFSYLANCQGDLEFSIGDARNNLTREAPQNFDVLILDAFSGDAIPAHLLTAEAFDLYWKHLKPDGVLAVHVSNAHLDLKPVVMGLAKRSEKSAALVVNQDADRFGVYESDWVLVSNNQEFLLDRELDAVLKPFPPDAKPIVWTDDFSDLFSILK